MTTTVRLVASILMALLLLFIAHRYFIFWHGWPDFSESLGQLFSTPPADQGISRWQSIAVIGSYALILAILTWRTRGRTSESLLIDSARYAAWSAYVVRFAFWSVFLIGIIDTAISALRIENALTYFVSTELNSKLGQAHFRGVYVHYPLLALSAIIAALTKNLSMIWLAFLVVLAEFSIVLTRFIFSYEQAYMGDLVRFWYAALFLFASAYTLVEEGHVRVDVLYAGMHYRSKAWVNTLGSLLLGIPLCFTILILGMESRQSALSSPIVNFEISQSAYGLFVKYLMAGFLIIFAVSMAMQFVAFFTRSSAVLLGDKEAVAISKGGH